MLPDLALSLLKKYAPALAAGTALFGLGIWLGLLLAHVQTADCRAHLAQVQAAQARAEQAAAQDRAAHVQADALTYHTAESQGLDGHTEVAAIYSEIQNEARTPVLPAPHAGDSGSAPCALSPDRLYIWNAANAAATALTPSSAPPHVVRP